MSKILKVDFTKKASRKWDESGNLTDIYRNANEQVTAQNIILKDVLKKIMEEISLYI
tara:strand:+ start:119 stop:289 length:171 start_codon:yes stop_codon:yes gene_type:complete